MPSWQKQIEDASNLAREDAKLKERSRVLSLFNAYILELEQHLEQKLLIESHRHLIEVKLKIAQKIIGDLRMRVMSGMVVAAPKADDSSP